MSRRPASKRDPRQRAALALATPRRVLLEVDATPWELLSREDRARAHRPADAIALVWSPLGDEGQPPTAYRSSPVARELWPVLLEAVIAVGLPAAAVRAVDALCWAHVAVVAYPDGHAVAFGLSEAPRDHHHAEVHGFPFARVEGRRVRPWAGLCHGHTDGEVLAASRFIRPRANVEASAEGAVS
ncbi:MAG: hypothetical protein Q8S73_24570 [Deltaproteobacteria bacterium]|nr:hypothetical protein [Myxococcales bacterium]MDP3217309.1 hypothetical protein [Deltaproteobacteria bacterium]